MALEKIFSFLFFFFAIHREWAYKESSRQNYALVTANKCLGSNASKNQTQSQFQNPSNSEDIAPSPGTKKISSSPNNTKTESPTLH